MAIDPNKRLRRSASRSIQHARNRNIDPQAMFGDPATEKPSFSDYSSRMEATRRRNAMLGQGGGDVAMASGRPRDPMFYWRQNNIPFDFTKPAELRKIREFCNTPDAPILMADGTSKPISQVVVGDQVVGWTNEMAPSGSLNRRWCVSTVTATNTRTASNVVSVSLASGATVKCTSDHKWANPYFTVSENYTVSGIQRLTEEYRPAQVGQTLLAVAGTYNIISPQDFDGQPAPDVAPTSQDEVVSITELSPQSVVSMQTTTGNYVAWGYASKNCRLLYMTHPVISACVDIYSKLPIQGLHVECKDDQLVEFYTDLFLDQLKYEDHLVRMGRQYWLAGEVFSIGAWNETLGVWENEELIHPDDVEVETSMFIDKPTFLMRLPEKLRKVLTERSPAWQYHEILAQAPELMNYVGEDDLMPVSSYIMHQLRFEADDYSNRGISILMRAFRTIIQEEMLMTALDSIADRLYTPMIVVKLGASATDLGTDTPWIPTPEQKAEFNASLDAALAADFRVLTTHFATDIETVFGRENVPDLTNDFDRITERILLAFGLSQTMLTGASQGETFAADALNRDVVTQLLTHYQRKLQQFFKERAEIVAEAQEHFDYEVRNGQRFLITEEVYEVDEETGEERIVEQPKLLVPELKFKVLNLTDETQLSEFVEELAEANVPIPIHERIRRVPGLDFDEMIEVRQQETIALAVAEQETRRDLYMTLKAQNLPIPDDLKKDFDPKAVQMGQEAGLPGGASDVPVPQLGAGPQDLPVLAPSPDDDDADQMAQGEQEDDDQTNEETDPDNDLPEEGDDVPPESNEERGRMPKPAMRTKAVRKLGIRQVTRDKYEEPDNYGEEDKSKIHPQGRFAMPRVVGMRRYIHVPEDLRLPKDED